MAAAESSLDAMRLDRGDVLKITVYSRPELSGTYPIGSNGVIRVPLLGTMEVAGKHLDVLEKELTARVSALLDYDAPVTVEMAQYRPIFITGDVANPGEHEYRPGLRVIQAVARAGGVAVSSARNETTAIDALRARKKLLATLLEVQMLTIRHAALAQTLDGVDNISFPNQLESSRNTPLLRILLRDQQALMDVGRKRLRDTRSFAERQRRQMEDEIDALLAQRKALLVQSERVARALEGTQSLRDKGLTTSTRMLAQQQMDADARIDLHRVSAYLSRVRQAKIELEQDLDDDENAWRQEHLRDRAKVAADLAKAQTELESAQQEALALGSAFPDRSAPGLKDLQFVITRPKKSGVEDLKADPEAFLQAGDVLQVSLPPLRKLLEGVAYEDTHEQAPTPKTESELKNLTIHN